MLKTTLFGTEVCIGALTEEIIEMVEKKLNVYCLGIDFMDDIHMTVRFEDSADPRSYHSYDVYFEDVKDELQEKLNVKFAE